MKISTLWQWWFEMIDTQQWDKALRIARMIERMKKRNVTG